MTKPKTLKERTETRKVRDLAVKPAASATVKGGYIATGKAFPRVELQIHPPGP
jgi:hypothetical protein